MRIEFDPTNPTEAAAVRAMLTGLGGSTALTPRPVDPVAMTEVGERIAQTQAEGWTLTGETITDDQTERTPALTVQSVDSQGEPHDPRIHSTPPKPNQDGTWRAKRGVTAEQIAAVRAGREAAQPVTLADESVEEHIAEVASIAATDGAGMTVTENPETGERTVSVEAEQFVVSAPPAPPAPIAVEHPDGSVTLPDSPIPPVYAPSFLDVMKAITAAQKDGKIDTAKVKELCAAVGAGESTMGLNGPDNGERRVAFMALLGEVVA